jgi:predicted RNA-binding protein with PIN domain
MPYLVDGHNLIPKIPGLALSDPEDEQRLIELLVEFCNRQSKQVEVFFDNAPPGGTRARNFGRVTARFVRQGLPADEAIRKRLGTLGRTARNWTVVSSDQAVQAEARAAQARVLTSDAFARLLNQTVDAARPDPGASSEANLKPEEVEEWLKLFNEGKDKDR